MIKRKKQREGNIIHIYDPADQRGPFSAAMVITILLIFVGGLGSAVAAAQLSGAGAEVRQAQVALDGDINANTALRGQMTEPYTLDEIARMATSRLGMARPEPAQIIYIYVPRETHMVLNADVQVAVPRAGTVATARENVSTFWRSIWRRVFPANLEDEGEPQP